MNFASIYQKEKGFVWTGIAGIILGVICILCLLIQGSNAIPPEGKWSKAITFNLAFGIFSLTMAALLPFIKISDKQRKRFVYPLIFGFWVGYVIETVQNIRGFDPRFSKAGTIFDQLIGLGLGIDSLLITICLVYWMIIAFKNKKSQYPLLVQSIHYANVSVMLGILSGVWMVVLQGRVTPDQVDIMALHFVGFHGFQAIPLVGWLISKANVTTDQAKKIVHLSGISWLTFCLLLFVQSGLGFAVYELSVVLIPALLSFLLWGFTTIYSLQKAMHSKANPKL